MEPLTWLSASVFAIAISFLAFCLAIVRWIFKTGYRLRRKLGARSTKPTHYAAELVYQDGSRLSQ